MSPAERQARVAALPELDRRRLVHFEGHPIPHHKLVARVAHTLNADPVFQLKLHIWATYQWVVQMVVAVPICFFFFRHFWLEVAVFYLTEISLAALVETEYGAVPAAESAVHAQAIREGR